MVTSDAVLPLSINRRFELWAYEVSHRRLILRTDFDDGPDVVEVEFLDVLGMKVKSYYNGLIIEAAKDGSEIDEFVGIPEGLADRYGKLVVSDGGVEGFVVCAKVRVREE